MLRCLSSRSEQKAIGTATDLPIAQPQMRGFLRSSSRHLLYDSIDIDSLEQASFLHQTIDRLPITPSNGGDDDDDNDDDDEEKQGNKDSPTSLEPVLQRVFHKAFPEDQHNYFDVIGIISPLVEMLARLPFILLSTTRIYPMLCLIFCREFYYLCRTHKDVEITERPHRLLLLEKIKRSIRVILKACKEEKNMFRPSCCLYWVTLLECYRLAERALSEVDGGGDDALFLFLQNECCDYCTLLASMKAMKKMVSIPKVYHFLIIFIIELLNYCVIP